MLCPCAAIGWAKPEQDAFMRLAYSGAPPPVPELSATSRSDLAPCGAKLQRLVGFCSLCFDPVDCSVRLSNGELLCVVCASGTFDCAEQHDATALTPRVALMARITADGHVCPEDVCSSIHGRARELLCTLRVGDELRFCGCISSPHVRGQLGVFVGYDVRRQLALLRIGRAIACMRMASSDDALMIRHHADDAPAKHERMLRDLTRVANRPTLYGAISAVRAAHTLCGSSVLAAAEAVLARLSDEEAATPLGISPYEQPPSRLLQPCMRPQDVVASGGTNMPTHLPPQSAIHMR